MCHHEGQAGLVSCPRPSSRLSQDPSVPVASFKPTSGSKTVLARERSCLWSTRAAFWKSTPSSFYQQANSDVLPWIQQPALASFHQQRPPPEGGNRIRVSGLFIGPRSPSCLSAQTPAGLHWELTVESCGKVGHWPHSANLFHLLQVCVLNFHHHHILLLLF